MHLHIRHETLYRYGDPVKRSIQNLRLTPRRDPMQRALSWSISAPGRHHAQIDAYGNVVHLLTLDQPHREIHIVVHGVVETLDEQASLPDEGQLSPLAYLANTTLTQADERLRSFAAEYLHDPGDRYSQLVELAKGVCDVVRYEPGATEVHESATTVFTRGKGVCQDHAHVFIACCRAAGIPARYVSGYLYTGDDGHIASHAWVDAWLETEKSWRSIDVTHRKDAHTNYCRLAVGRDYLDACPVRGVRRGGGHEDMQVLVTVGASGQQ